MLPAVDVAKKVETASFHIRPLLASDYAICAQIYADGMATGYATFETEVPSWEVWHKKYISSCRLVIVSEGKVCGWAGLTPFSQRAVYKGVAEISIYIVTQARGKGFGTALLSELIRCSENQGIYSLLAKIFPENSASIQMHKNLGFTEVGTLKRIAKRDGLWHDNMLLQRRSTIND